MSRPPSTTAYLSPREMEALDRFKRDEQRRSRSDAARVLIIRGLVSRGILPSSIEKAAKKEEAKE